MLPCQKSHNVLTSLALFVKNGGEGLKKALFCIIIYYIKILLKGSNIIMAVKEFKAESKKLL